MSTNTRNCRSTRDVLRRAIAVPHERIHEAPAFAAIASGQLDSSGYVELLTRMAAFYFPVGAALDRGDERWALLSRDLDFLGSAGPRCLIWTPPSSPQVRLGWLYVMKGSSLGGQVVYSQLDYLFGASLEGRSFFKGSGSDKAGWQALCASIESEGRTPGAVDQIVEGASDAFELFDQIISGSHVHG